MKLFITIVFLTLVLFADSDGYKEMHLPKDLSFLNLNKKQKKIIRKLLQEHRKKLKILHKAEEKWEEDLKKEFAREHFSKENFKKKALRLKKEVIEVEANFFNKIHSILNKKQRKKFIEYIEEWEVE